MPERSADGKRDEGEHLVREAWAEVRFSLDEALIHSGGGSLLSGSDQESAYERARRAIRAVLKEQVRDAVLEQALNAWLDLHRQQIEAHANEPARCLAQVLEQTRQSDGLFIEFVRTVDVHYGQIMQERPFFQQPVDPPHPDDPHTFDSVRNALEKLVSSLPRFRAS